MTINAILVPQGAEYQAVCRGLSQVRVSTPPVFPIPVGVKPVTEYLEKWLKDGHLQKLSEPNVLLMGLCGSLSPRCSVGDAVLYENCTYRSPNDELLVKECDRALTDFLYNSLNKTFFFSFSRVRSFTSDRLIFSALEKSNLGKNYDVEVVDMEGFAAVKMLSYAGFAVAMLRVISDDCQQNLPDISAAISSDGSLKPLPLTIGMLRQPMAAIRLIKGSLTGLQVLQKLAAALILTADKER